MKEKTYFDRLFLYFLNLNISFFTLLILSYFNIHLIFYKVTRHLQSNKSILAEDLENERTKRYFNNNTDQEEENREEKKFFIFLNFI